MSMLTAVSLLKVFLMVIALPFDAKFVIAIFLVI
jgi:hypothetical protein